MKNNQTGSVLAVVIVTTVVVGIVVASMLDLLNTQRRLNLRKELQLQANEASETAVDYAYSYIINDINSNSLGGAASIPSSGYRSFTFSTSAQNFLKGSVLTPGYTGYVSGVNLSNPDVRVLAPPSTGNRFFIDGTDPANAGDPNKNQWVVERLVPIVTSVTATQSGQKYTAYIQKGVSSREIALFQYAIFFQGQLHLHRGYGLMGGVHANGNLFLNAHDGDGAKYNGAVTSAHHIYRGSTFDQGGTGSDSFGYVAVTAETSGGWADTSASPTFNPVATGLSTDLEIYANTTGGVDNFVELASLDSRTTTWKTDAENYFKGHLEDSAMESPVLAPIGTVGYAQDVTSTTSVNEFNNAPYALLEPNLPVGNSFHQTNLSNNLEARACLLLLVEYNDDIPNPLYLHKTSDGSEVNIRTIPLNTLDLTQYSDPWRAFVVKAYKVDTSWDPNLGTDIHNYLHPVTLPGTSGGHFHVIGQATSDVTHIPSGGDLKFEDFDVALTGSPTPNETLSTVAGTSMPLMSSTFVTTYKSTVNSSSSQGVSIIKGLFDPRLGRGVAPLTIDIDALKKALETPVAKLDSATSDYTFRSDFDPTAMLPATPLSKAQWNGLIYIEFPTSLALQDTNAYAALPRTAPAGVLNNNNGIYTRKFAYATVAELRHPDRWDTTDNFGRANRTDGIVPMADALRRYPPAAIANLNSTILDAQYAIPAVQIINGGTLPHPNVPADPTKNTEGFTIATNAPLYLIGNYNSDGNYNTGTNFTSTSPTGYATADSAAEIPAAIFCDTFTVLSNGWGETPSGYTSSNRKNSFYGANNGSTNGSGSTSGSPGNVGSPPGRPARPRSSFTNSDYNYSGSLYTSAAPFVYPATATYIEISACVATGEYPIFEFFTHALENYNTLYSARDSTHPNPIIFKGSVVAMFHSEIQHIKQAYGRNVNSDIQTYYQQHGAFAICAVRYHSFLVNGYFPPGTPTLYVTQPKDFRILHWNDADDASVLTSAGYTAP